MKKLIIIATLLSISTAALANQLITVSPAKLKQSDSRLIRWSIHGSNTAVKIDAFDTSFNVLITVDAIMINGLPGDGVDIYCNGNSFHINPGSAGLCYVDFGDYVSWNDDELPPNNGSSGTYQLISE